MELLNREKTDVLFKVFNTITDNDVNIDEYMYMGSKKDYINDNFIGYIHFFKNKLTRSYTNMTEGDIGFSINPPSFNSR
tara:strand:+ start:435 stop:671 length:237 start_codon:yes stop_codon:yes gene_type:complete